MDAGIGRRLIETATENLPGHVGDHRYRQHDRPSVAAVNHRWRAGAKKIQRSLRQRGVAGGCKNNKNQRHAKKTSRKFAE